MKRVSCWLLVALLSVPLWLATVCAAPPQPGSSSAAPQQVEKPTAKKVQPGTAVVKPQQGLEVQPFNLLKVTLPKNGDYAEIGETLGVFWDYSPVVGQHVNIWLTKGTSPIHKIVGNLDIANTVHHGMIPNSIVPGSDYRVMIESVEKPNIKVYSTGFFTLRKTPPGIQVMVPNTGQTWARGTTQNIGWFYTGNLGSTVKITLEKPGVPAMVIVGSYAIHQQIEHFGTYAWTISNNLTPGSDYKIKVQVNNSQYADTSDQPFTIN